MTTQVKDLLKCAKLFWINNWKFFILVLCQLYNIFFKLRSIERLFEHPGRSEISSLISMMLQSWHTLHTWIFSNDLRYGIILLIFFCIERNPGYLQFFSGKSDFWRSGDSDYWFKPVKLINKFRLWATLMHKLWPWVYDPAWSVLAWQNCDQCRTNSDYEQGFFTNSLLWVRICWLGLTSF